MKKLLFIIGTLLLAGCGSIEQRSPQYIENHDKYVEIHTELRDCMQAAVDTQYYGLERLRLEVQSCDIAAFNQLRFKDDPESYYVDAGEGFGPYEDFSYCSSSVASGMWEFPPEVTTDDYRSIIKRCINAFPSL